MAERDTALRQVNTSAQELSQLRESSSALQQQLHVVTLEKQAELEKAVKVTRSHGRSTGDNIGSSARCLACMVELFKHAAHRGLAIRKSLQLAVQCCAAQTHVLLEPQCMIN